MQWEDFKHHNALRLLDRYRHRIASFNDDIQGTAAVVVGGILAALRQRRQRLSDQRIVLLGAGAAGTGTARLIRAAVDAEGEPGSAGGCTLALLDSRGLIFDGRDGVDEHKRPFALPRTHLTRFGFQPAGRYDLTTVVQQIAPTVLVGTTGVAGAFAEAAIRAIAERVPAPIVLPLSNPTIKSEATPADVLAWTGGRALVATGSPFAPVRLDDGTTRLVGQANNVFVFPGVGLGAIVSRTREVTDRMFLVAAKTLATVTPAERIDQGALYPRLADLRSISRAIAVAVAREAVESGMARMTPGIGAEAAVDAAMWTPDY